MHRIHRRDAERQAVLLGDASLHKAAWRTLRNARRGPQSACAPYRSLRRTRRKPEAAQRLCSPRSFQKRSSQASQFIAEVARVAEKRIFDGVLGCAQAVANRPELCALAW